ncbi:MAG: MoxR family ATPase [Lachnospiraceae bacterium]|nr:MoxR family ATPase [Lachnospiraceae bacterium]
MNIQEAKEELIRTVKAYTRKDEFDNYKIPDMRQRPIFLIGAPGIGKTAIVEQAARECHVGLVAYTITHHTRQSAIGLPVIEKKTYRGETYTVTDYTMSEIVAAIYEKMEESECEEGILFLDEINCVSETLAPAMLQFLQYKSFGNHKIPSGWVIVAAGNPPEYNKAVREFDMATMDRMRKIEVEVNFEAWRSYAERNGVHGAILSYLDAKKDQFYRVENTADGLRFVTARGWEDLSEMIWSYEEIGETVTENLIVQYLQREETAHDFALYLALYYKYKKEYDVVKILRGTADRQTYQKLAGAPFDERLSVVNHLLEALLAMLKGVVEQDELVSVLYEVLKRLKEPVLAEKEKRAWEIVRACHVERGRILEIKKKVDLVEEKEAKREERLIRILQNYEEGLQREQIQENEDAFDWIREQFQGEVDKRRRLADGGLEALDHGFAFIEEMFGLSQEMVVFVTAISKNYEAVRFISEFGCEPFFLYHRELLFSETRRELLEQIKKYT